MSETPLKNQIITWLRDCDYWLQYAGNRLIEGENVTEELVSATYLLFKEDYGLKEIEVERVDIAFNEITVSSIASTGQLQLKTIKEIENVNALAPGQSIEINPNLTIIYGGNGTGKSGYIRMLNNAFNSRGDKQILPNIFNDAATGKPCCNFTFQSDTSTYDLRYPSQKDNSEFTQFSVFDSHSVRVHLEQDNKLNFTPSGFEVFEKLLQLYEAVTNKLNAQIEVNQPANDFEKYFVNENSIQVEIANLGVNTDIDKLKGLGGYTETDANKLSEVITKREEMKALNIPKKITELQKLQSQLTEFVTQHQAILDLLKQEDIDYCKSLIESLQKFQELVNQEGINNLESYNIEALGSKEWRDFIQASKSYSSTIIANRGNGGEYPAENDKCLFCLQPLAEKENTLVKSYWKLLKSEAEVELNLTTQKILEVGKKLKEHSPIKFDETSTLFTYVKFADSELSTKWKNLIGELETTRQNLISNLSNGNLDFPIAHFTLSTEEFDPIEKRLKDSIESLFQKNPTKELGELEVQVKFLDDKSLLNKLLDKVLEFIAYHKWAAKAESCVKALNTRSITTKQGELFTQHITEKYTNTFNTECKKLNAPKVVNIVQKNAKVSTLRKLQVAGQVANDILSEGEQRAISLADFLTEVQLNPKNKGVIFDDPVNSQDHYRREWIAERLVEIASYKQVIIFTHDIAFFIRLKIFAEVAGLNHYYTTIRNIGGTPGVISPNLPWIAQNVKKRIGTLKDRLVKLKKIESENNPDEYLFAAKSWYNLLREAWERVVEERLFKGVVERFLLGVQTQKLKKVIVTNDLISEIERGMTESSNWLHDAGAGLNPTPPDTTKAASDLKDLDEFAKKCVTA